MNKKKTTRASLLAAGSMGIAVLAVGPTAAPALSTPALSTAAAPAAAGGGYLAPYFTAADLTGDREVTVDDLDLLVEAMGTTSTDASWPDVAPADLDADLVITVSDLAALSQRVLHDDGDFALVEASAVEMQKAMNAGVVTSVQLTQAYLDRIAAYDRTVVDTSPTGRALASIIATSDVALEAAAASDAARAVNGGPSSMLDGIPVLLKDNYDTVDMPTTAGCGCWEDNQTEDDAAMVEGLRADGAIILGKASLDEFAFGFTSQFSAGSEPGDTVYVASPYATDKTAGGSSGGTGAAIAANLGAIGFGTDTGGSIRVPSSYNQLVGVRPTVGLASRDGIVPLALSQDTGGPMTRSVSDAAIALDAVVGSDPADPVTADADDRAPESYTSYLDPEALAGVRIGYLASMLPNDLAVQRLWAQAVEDLEAQGATVEEISIDGIDPVLGEGSGSTNEFKHDLDDYIEAHLGESVAARSLRAIIDTGHIVPSRASTYDRREQVTAEEYDAWMESHTAVLEGGRALVTGALDDNDLDAIVYPSGRPYGTHSTNMRLSPNTGLPAVTVPMGQAVATDLSVTGAGVNLEFLGREYAEGDLLGMTYAYEQATAHRTTPELYGALAGDVLEGVGSDESATPGDGTVTISAPAKVKAGQEFTVTVEQDAADLYAYDLSIGFDPGAVTYVVDSAGTDDTGATYESTGEGEVAVTHTKLGTSPATSGETTLATLTFVATASGPTGLVVEELETVDSEGTATTVVEAADAEVAVRKVPTSHDVDQGDDKVSKGSKVSLVATVGAAGSIAPTGKVKVLVDGDVVRRAEVVDGVAETRFKARSLGRSKVIVRFLPADPFKKSKGKAVFRTVR
ncbi:MAG: amidase family protein [Nocardioides marinisabuli]|uniref:amidase family protein n=1 Tax=Nocardioides marinisabuli TaxID=419476 RepID=UPI00321A6579